MRALSFYALLSLATLAAPVHAQSTMNVLDTVSGQQVDDQSQADDVRLRTDVNDRMTVAVRLAGSGPFRFLVDTGADRTAISSALAARLRLEPGEAVALHSMTGITTVPTAVVPNLQLSRSNLHIVDAPLLDAENMGADGILGTDSLRSQRVMFDFEKNVMTIVPSRQRSLPAEEGSVVVTGRLRNGRLIVTNALADGQRITVILDTGSEVSVGNDALRRRLASSGLVKSNGPIDLQSVTGDKLPGEYAFVERLDIGQVSLGDLAVVFADAHTFKRLGLDKRPALLLGMNALRAFKKVSIDFANKKLRVMLPETGALDRLSFAAR